MFNFLWRFWQFLFPVTKCNWNLLERGGMQALFATQVASVSRTKEKNDGVCNEHALENKTALRRSCCPAVWSSDPFLAQGQACKQCWAAGVIQKGECDIHTCQLPLRSGAMWPGVDIGTVTRNAQHYDALPWDAPECRVLPGSLRWAVKWLLGFPHRRSMGEGG